MSGNKINNAIEKRVFLLMNKLWTSKKTQLQVAVLKVKIVTKVDFKKSKNFILTSKQYQKI